MKRGRIFGTDKEIVENLELHDLEETRQVREPLGFCLHDFYAVS